MAGKLERSKIGLQKYQLPSQGDSGQHPASIASKLPNLHHLSESPSSHLQNKDNNTYMGCYEDFKTSHVQNTWLRACGVVGISQIVAVV